MKKKILSVLLAVSSVASCAVVLNACGKEKDKSLDYLTFTLLEDDTYSVGLKDNYRVVKIEGSVAILDGADKFKLRNTVIKIPATYNGKAVTQVADFGFYNSLIKGVEIPSGVTYIGVEAFAGAENLQSVSLPNTLKIVATQAFDNTERESDGGELLKIVVPSSVEYISDYAFDMDVDLYYNGTTEEFSTIKRMYRSDQGLIYTENAYVPHSESKWYFYSDDISDITGSLSPEKTVKGVWKYNEKQQIESVAIEYGNTVNGNTYEYENSVVSLTDEFWQMMVRAQAQGMLDSLLTPEEVEMFTSSSNKEEYAEKCEAYNATALSGMRVVFENGQMTLWQNDVQYSQPFDYVEANGAVYYKLRGVYSLIYTLDGGKIVENSATEYGGANHYYTKQAQ